MKERILVNYESLKEDVDLILDEISSIRKDRRCKQILGSEIERIKDWEFSLRKKMNEPFNLVIIGDFKRGKSTLVNALLGAEVVPTDILPETVTINRISYGENESCTAILSNGKKARLDIKELNRSELEKIMKELPAKIEYIDVLQNNELLKEITIVDTPGIGDIFKEYDEQVSEYLKNADALIYVVGAKSPLSQTEQSFISAAVIPQSFSRIFVVLNMIDALQEKEDMEKVAKLTRDRIAHITPNATVYPLSALDEYCRQMNVKRPLHELEGYFENQFEVFRTAIQSDIIMKKDGIKTNRVVTLADFMLNDITNRINLFVSVLESNVGSLADLEAQYHDNNSTLMQKINQEISTIQVDIDEMQLEARAWIREFMNRIKREIQSIQGAIGADVLQRYFQFYMIEMIKDGVITCTKYHQEDINSKLQKASKSISLEIIAAFGSIDTQIADSISDISWTSVDTAMFAGDYILGSIGGLNLGPIMLIGQAIAGFIRQKEVSKKQREFLEPVLENFDYLVDEIQDEVKVVYEKIKKTAVERLNSIYSNQIEESLAAINQAKQVIESEEMKKDEIVEYLDEIKKIMDELKLRLKQYH